MDPSYNPYEVAPTARAAAPPRPAADAIDALPVSAAWKRRFRLIEKAGGPQLGSFRDLPFGERLAIGFNVLGLLFGPLYCLAKGLWRPAIACFAIAFAAAFVGAAAGIELPARAAGYGVAFACAHRANVLYYRKVVLGERPWL
ncbi:DUF2628 domain-containing protein [Vulcaniibacterium tengchongense]|uniref:Uncharacterized protein DUF2628 n=1 Tax=Vulcaniibacterium tengchongense TaxID=1273429 RepID=A0A3N4VEI6_9GAMM|nr:DUF2628 domain-containing protein [Vulcaniibacterium tengchongense]RPE79915.1 uncharacterized protein DUF2628 [Vulcaniibacterium tengchongense]